MDINIETFEEVAEQLKESDIMPVELNMIMH